MSSPIVTSLQASLLAQWSTLFINFISFFQTLKPQDQILKTVLIIETFVQVVELIFYSWQSTHFNQVAEITQYRQHDWAITTPLMLFSTIIYQDYQNNPDETVTLESFWKKYSTTTWIIFGFNLLMLAFGYTQERGLLDLGTSTALGFLGFAGSFWVMWDSFASKSPENYPLQLFMFIVWALQGVAALLDSVWKNVSYNLLDVVAKNFQGVFLSYLIAQKAI